MLSLSSFLYFSRRKLSMVQISLFLLYYVSEGECTDLCRDERGSDFTFLTLIFQEENAQTYDEMNEVLMMQLRAMCESRQKEHAHISDSSTNKTSLRQEVSSSHAHLYPQVFHARTSLFFTYFIHYFILAPPVLHRHKEVILCRSSDC